MRLDLCKPEMLYSHLELDAMYLKAWWWQVSARSCSERRCSTLTEGSSQLWARPATEEHVRMRTDRRWPSPLRWLCGSHFFRVGIRGGAEACPLQRTHGRWRRGRGMGLLTPNQGEHLMGVDSPSRSLLRKAKASGLFPEWQVRSLGHG